MRELANLVAERGAPKMIVQTSRRRRRRLVDDYNTERPHYSLGYAPPAAFAAELEKQWAGCSQPTASTALARNDNSRSPLYARSKMGFTSRRMMSQSVKYMDLDVNKNTIAVAIAEEGQRSEVREHGRLTARQRR
ncbi:hypothetical protein EWE75_20370 [Sphingomonas populi]|uniref:Integrase catalytic domain-containing protein n=1 Tax=Sphingomonas populi TaxID=2484750 RepID=A0A4Q6XU08_9SPHN|nr:hypothetical protein EWE75_20370 [Sphingomonas populi]